MSLHSLEPLVETLTHLDGDRWRNVTVRMRWLVISEDWHDEEIPEVLTPYRNEILDPNTWAKVRNEVKARRRKIYREEASSRNLSKAEKRREYMRNYMQVYRRNPK